MQIMMVIQSQYTILGLHSSKALKLQILFRSPSVERIGKHIYQETIVIGLYNTMMVYVLCL